MYAKCESMPDARSVFNHMQYRDTVCWNALILGYAENRQFEESMHLYRSMDSPKNSRTYVAALVACSGLARESHAEMDCLENGMCIHSKIPRTDLNIFVENTLVDMYARCGSMLDARFVFDRMPHHSVVSWNTLLMGYVANGEARMALELFLSLSEGSLVNARTLLAAITAVTSLSERMYVLEYGKQIHGLVMRCETDVFVWSGLVEMYGKCGSLREAHEVFERMPCHNEFTWSSVIMGCIENGESLLALAYFDCMRSRGCLGDAHVFVAAFMAVGRLAEQGTSEGSWLERGIRLHSLAEGEMKCSRDAFVSTSLIDMYAKCGSMGEAERIFREMREPNVVSWTALIIGYVDNGEGGRALRAFEHMLQEGCVPNGRTFLAVLRALSDTLSRVREVHGHAASLGLDTELFVANTMIDIYGRHRCIEDAREVFDRMPIRDMVSWNSLLDGYVETAVDLTVVLELFERIKSEGLSPDTRTYISVLHACQSLDYGRQVCSEICRQGLEDDVFVASAAVDFYGKCGRTEAAQHMFESVGSPRDCVLWNALISGYSKQGDSVRVFRLFHEMIEDGVDANGVSFMSLLTVCSRAGMINRGKLVFEHMRSEYNVEPGVEHYHCLIDLLGRGNLLEDAVRVAENMPYEANELTWSTVLGACQMWKNVEVAKVAFERVVRLNPQGAVSYVTMANICSLVN